MPASVRRPFLSAILVLFLLAAVGCRDDVPESPTVTPAFTGVPAAAPGASGIRIVERGGPPPFRSVYGPGGIPTVLPPGSMGDPGAPTLKDDPLEDDPFEDEDLDDESPAPNQPPPGGPALPPSGIGL